ncbi:MAG: hypothetical protein M1113_02825, partial [Candidatus Thermoplasmatota archaeon]|nr:hypothetical protein [Candidatus Thermoplasmatota archaeon]
MARSILKSVRIKEEDWKTLSDNKISFDQEFVHNCVLQLKDRHDNRDEVLSVVINDTPSFLFTNTATNEELYSYLKENPSASRFIFKKYTANQSFIKELVDPENPIYLDGVANNLKEIYQIKEEIENVEKLRSEKGNLNNEISKLRDEIKLVEDEYDGIYGNLEKIRKEDEEYSRQRTNIRTDKGLEMLEQSIKEITTFQNTFLDKWNKYFSGNPTAIGMTMDRNEINLMSNINKQL